MRIAILVSGQPRFTNDFNLFLKNLKGYDHADWFCYFTPDNNSVPADKLPNPYWKEIKDANIASGFLQSMLPVNNFIKVFELSDSDYINLPLSPPGCPDTTYKDWYNLYQVNQLRLKYEERNNVSYDLIIRLRPDIGLIDELNLDDINLNILENSIITPKNKIAGHINLDPNVPKMCNLFVIANSSLITAYCDMITDAHNNFFTKNRYTWHIESAHALHLQNNNVKITTGNFNISIRGDAN